MKRFGYMCACGKQHPFDAWALAHQHIELVHACECGRENVLKRGAVVSSKVKQ